MAALGSVCLLDVSQVARWAGEEDLEEGVLVRAPLALASLVEQFRVLFGLGLVVERWLVRHHWFLERLEDDSEEVAADLIIHHDRQVCVVQLEERLLDEIDLLVRASHEHLDTS